MQIKLEKIHRPGRWSDAKEVAVVDTCLVEARITPTKIFVEGTDRVSNPSAPFASKERPMVYNRNGYMKRYGISSTTWEIAKDDLDRIKALPVKVSTPRQEKDYQIIVTVKAKTVAGAKSIIRSFCDDRVTVD